ncbi:histone deacetylase-like amidohydrolase [bacterium BMS3Abin02]|nr:histone deacetylase-like amidohydrolase [bacterium BMS3Abin02]GBE21187.1 histone deacetylase-like amidohydrolase [bacterium BMS3Bbin01]
MRVLLVTHEAMLRHDTGPWHPERSERLAAVIRGVQAGHLEVVGIDSPMIDPVALRTVHRPDYIEMVRRTSTEGRVELDPDTPAGPGSWEAALRAAGSGPAAVEQLRAGSADVAFLAIRPPGHHALADRAMGFCLFNNIAITARMLADEGERVAIVDWDIHHGNATQDAFLMDPSVLYVSLHQFPFYPGTGWVEEVGIGPGAGTTVNISVPVHTAGDLYSEAFARAVIPILEQFEPDWILVSAGYDGHREDPIAEASLLERDYQMMASAVRAAVPNRRLIFFLEGGYNLAAMERSVTATIAGIAGEAVPSSVRLQSPDGAWRILDLLMKAQRPYWQL